MVSVIPSSDRYFTARYWSNIIECIAMKSHELYIKMRQNYPRSNDPAVKPWTSLEVVFKNADRNRASALLSHLTKIGYFIMPSFNKSVELSQFTEYQVELIAISFHEDWVKERICDGWKFGKVKNIVAKQSPFICQWNDLPEMVQEADRNFASESFKIISYIGFRIYKKEKNLSLITDFRK